MTRWRGAQWWFSVAAWVGAAAAIVAIPGQALASVDVILTGVSDRVVNITPSVLQAGTQNQVDQPKITGPDWSFNFSPKLGERYKFCFQTSLKNPDEHSSLGCSSGIRYDSATTAKIVDAAPGDLATTVTSANRVSVNFGASPAGTTGSTSTTKTPALKAGPVTAGCIGGTNQLAGRPNEDFLHPFGICLDVYLKNLYNWALVIGSGLAVMMVMWSGYTYVVAAGDPEAIRTAKDYLWGALLGLGLLLLTYALLQTLAGPATGTQNGGASPTTTNAPASSSGSGQAQPPAGGGGQPSTPPPATPTPVSIAGTYQATITDIQWSGTCPDNIKNKPEYQRGASQSVTVVQSGTAVTVSALGKSASGTLAGNVATIPLGGSGDGSGQMIVTFVPAQGKVGVRVNYTQTKFIFSCNVQVTIAGEK